MIAAMQTTTPALIQCDPQVGDIRIAALTLLDRLVVALHRAGCQPIRIVCAGALPSLKRSKALGIETEILPAMPAVVAPTLVADCRLLVQAADVRAVIAGNGRLVTPAGEALPIGMVSRVESDLNKVLNSLPPIAASGVCGVVTDAASARKVETRLWASLASSTDGVVDKYFNRPLGRFLSKALIHTPVTPNQVTVASTLIGLAGAWFFAQGNYTAGILGAFLLQMSALVDCVDGEVARIVFKESPIGKWLDLGLDQVVHVAVFAAIAIGLSQHGGNAPVFWLGISAVAGAVISFPVVVRARRLADKETDTRLEKFIDAASTRDFTALILFLAFIERLEWFLWLTGVSVHIFWVMALLLQLPKGSKTNSANGRAA